MSYIYVLVTAGRPIYVGSTAHIKDRLGNHNSKRFDSVYYQEVVDDKRFELELQIILDLRPELNRMLRAPVLRTPFEYHGERITIRMESEELKRVKSAAKADNRSPSNWCRIALLNAATSTRKGAA